jgi:hypothetical protein
MNKTELSILERLSCDYIHMGGKGAENWWSLVDQASRA